MLAELTITPKNYELVVKNDVDAIQVKLPKSNKKSDMTSLNNHV